MDLLPCVEVEPIKTATASVIWLHGFGADGHDFEPIVPELRLPPELNVRFIFPHAPQRPITMYDKTILRAWYDFTNWEKETEVETAGIYESAAQIEALIKRENARGIPTNKIVLAGFSQGGSMALHIGVRYPEKLAGIMALSTYLSTEHTLQAERTPANQDTSIFMAHGTQDNVVPFTDAQYARDELTKLGYKIEFHTYPMPHSVCPPEMLDIRQWLINALT